MENKNLEIKNPLKSCEISPNFNKTQKLEQAELEIGELKERIESMTRENSTLAEEVDKMKGSEADQHKIK